MEEINLDRPMRVREIMNQHSRRELAIQSLKLHRPLRPLVSKRPRQKDAVFVEE
jgi:hypothetical protein